MVHSSMLLVNFRSLGLVKPNKAKNSLSKASSGDGDCPGKCSNVKLESDSKTATGNDEEPTPFESIYLLTYI